MVGASEHVLSAAILFVGIHLLASTSLRPALVARIGEGAWRGLFSVFAGIFFVWMIWAYGNAPFDPVWPVAPWMPWVPILVMPVAMILLVAAVTTRNPSLAGMEATVSAPNPAVGIMTVTRHPLFWAIALWALAHILANGDRASIYMFGALALLGLLGMPMQDHKKFRTLGAEWAPYAMRTSAIPFVAAAQGRTAIDWRGIGWWRPLAGLALYAVVLLGHRHLFGVSPFPG
jgi:uncharacterized membrane protein